MMCRWFVAGVLWLCCAALGAQEFDSTSGPAGVAPYVELGHEAFLLGLYVPGGVNSAAEAFNRSGSRALVLKFTADRMTAGKLSRVHLQSIAINANPDLQRASANALAGFFNTLKGSLRRSDVLTISEKTDASGVKVYLNGQTLADIDDAHFFNLLLTGWIGSVPPSTEFKAALLGDTAPGIRQRFRQMQPSPERREAIAAWFQPQPQRRASPDSVADEPVRIADTKRDEALPEQRAGSGTAASVPVPRPSVPAKAVAEATDRPDQSANSASSLGSQPLAPSATPEQALETDLPNFSAASLTILQDYTARLVQLTHRQINYPRRAMKLKQTGSVRMAVVINSAGELVAMQPVLESQFPQLNDAVERAVEKAAPYPPLPAEVEAKRFEFVFPITFVLES